VDHKSKMKHYSINTHSRVEFVDITDLIRKAVRESAVRDGACIAYIPHTTAGITINENADPSVISDIIMQLGKIIPASGAYRHYEGNSDAHIKASLVGFSQTILIENGDLLLGTWQSIYFCEFDGPRQRKLYLKIIPSSCSDS